MRIEDDRVEGIAARLDAHPLKDGIASDEFEREAIDEGFRHRLDRE